MELIRLILMIIFIGSGLFVFGVATFGLFKLDYILNRVHVAAKCDTLASLLVIVGIIIYTGFSFLTLKLLLVIIFLWLTNPVATHLVGQTEVITNKDIEKECEVIE
ncbi:monovalent cation/H(+) antiporter subunit G [Tissierella sp. Yu-01]|uniref:cation:proton antiporter n=1 Tax=Tissierella sp. Yu-01 TaxID=3035694 RepID=UPI00240E21AF|nr:monovalent cation/H(+) antiporter subunit G [Tissierella sp. Yu-01]WFA08470.1 monovalent cation/H(+) antiporter subunit G [Tissierella sp. Yu-01]